ncbi:MAG: sulfurtransferase complex subunit TusD [Marinobacter sp.]|nr:sulfurtransferase complex subunit TusD [Marinobacter sp.]
MAHSTPLTYTLVITGAPYVSQAPQTALDFARAVIAAGHRIERVFLYGDGIHLASALASPPSDEINWRDAWCTFLQEQGVPGVACVASALRRGVVDSTEQARYELSGANLARPFDIAGLGEWVEGLRQSSRVIYFHPVN